MKPGIKYGPGMIGQAAFEAQKAADQDNPQQKYGPGMLGNDEPKKPVATEKPKPASPDQDAALDKLVAEYATDDGYLAIEDVKAILDEMPNAFDRIFGWELGRADGPRVGALNHLMQLEIKRDGGPRAMVQKRIELALAEVKGG